MKPTTRARSLALQVLYEVDIANHPPAEIYKLRLEDSPLADDLADFARQIIFGVLPLTSTLDQIIAIYAPEWPLDQIAAIDRNILRMALWEFAVHHETPMKVAINKAVELAKHFGSDFGSAFHQWCAGGAGRPSVRNPAGTQELALVGIRVWKFSVSAPLELIFILIIAIIVLGPRDMQKAGRTIGRWLNQLVRSDSWKVFQRTSAELRNLPRNLIRDANAEVAEMERDLRHAIDPRAGSQDPFDLHASAEGRTSC